MGKIFTADNPSKIYLEALLTAKAQGKVVAPRGKRVKEIRPVIVEFTNPYNRTTFLKGRKINPFFQLAEALWILRGRADVEWLTKFNANMAQFSDDGVYFNAPYGERLRFFNQNSYKGFVFNPHDQLYDVFQKLSKDKDTRQAVASIWNPLFDNVSYEGKDFPCNMLLDFKIRDNKLELVVFNRSNDIHWGTWGANLCQFSTIQEVMASWLGIECGMYAQITNSLHVYLDDYGAQITDDIIKAYGVNADLLEKGIVPIGLIEKADFETSKLMFKNEPRITLGKEDFDMFLDEYFYNVDPILMDDKVYESNEAVTGLIEMVNNAPDDYFRMTLLAMVAYRSHKLKNRVGVIEALKLMADSQWKLSCLYFLYNSYKEDKDYLELFSHFSEEQKDYIKGEM